MISDKLSNIIIKHRKVSKFTIVAICGAADLGKSHLSKKISEMLTRNNLKTNHLAMDSYLMGREVRIKKGLSGYDIETYNQTEALKDLIALKNGKSIEYKTYNHNEGMSSLNFSKMYPSDILIFEGLHAMHSSFLPYIDITIFLYTNDAFLKIIRSEADLVKRNYTSEFSKAISESELNLYKSNIEPYKEKADYILYIEKKWNYQLE